jgi:hypothetical protein
MERDPDYSKERYKHTASRNMRFVTGTAGFTCEHMRRVQKVRTGWEEEAFKECFKNIFVAACWYVH